MESLYILLVVVIAFVVNLPLGMWRRKLRKFSPAWLLAVHLSVPLIVFLRVTWGLPTAVVPVSIFAAVVGQKVGSQWLRL